MIVRRWRGRPRPATVGELPTGHGLPPGVAVDDAHGATRHGDHLDSTATSVTSPSTSLGGSQSASIVLSDGEDPVVGLSTSARR